MEALKGISHTLESIFGNSGRILEALESISRTLESIFGNLKSILEVLESILVHFAACMCVRLHLRMHARVLVSILV